MIGSPRDVLGLQIDGYTSVYVGCSRASFRYVPQTVTFLPHETLQSNVPGCLALNTVVRLAIDGYTVVVQL